MPIKITKIKTLKKFKEEREKNNNKRMERAIEFECKSINLLPSWNYCANAKQYVVLLKCTASN
jgi:hypothetical protein